MQFYSYNFIKNKNIYCNKNYYIYIKIKKYE